MLNHDSKQHNVRLVSAATAFGEMDKDADVPADLNDKDMLLVATTDIEEGTELLTQYIEEDEGVSLSSRAEIQAKKLIHWGFL
jgi:hypothetical protein